MHWLQLFHENVRRSSSGPYPPTVVALKFEITALVYLQQSFVIPITGWGIHPNPSTISKLQRPQDFQKGIQLVGNKGKRDYMGTIGFRI